MTSLTLHNQPYLAPQRSGGGTEHLGLGAAPQCKPIHNIQQIPTNLNEVQCEVLREDAEYTLGLWVDVVDGER